MNSDSYGIASRASGSDWGIRDRAGKKSLSSLTGWPWDMPLAAVGKPYKLPEWNAVCGDFLTSKTTFCSPKKRCDLARDCLREFDLNGRATCE